MLAEIKYMLLLQEKEDPEVTNINKEEKQTPITETTASTSHSETVND